MGPLMLQHWQGQDRGKNRGVKMPKGKRLSPETIQKIEKILKDGYGWPAISERWGIGFDTYCKIKSQWKKKIGA